MDPKVKQTVDTILEICIETTEILDRSHPDDAHVDWIDWEDTFNQVYAEIKQLMEQLEAGSA